MGVGEKMLPAVGGGEGDAAEGLVAGLVMDAVFGEVDGASVDGDFIFAGVDGDDGASEGEGDLGCVAGTDLGLHEVIKDKVAGADLVYVGEVGGNAAGGGVAVGEFGLGETLGAEGCKDLLEAAKAVVVYGLDLFGAAGLVAMACVGKDALETEFVWMLGDLVGEGDDLLWVMGGDACATVSAIDFYPEIDGVVEDLCEGLDGLGVVGDEAEVDVLCQGIEDLGFAGVGREGDEDVLPVVGCEVLGHLDGADGDLGDAFCPEPLGCFGGLDGLEVGSEVEVCGAGFGGHAVDVGLGLGGVDDEGGAGDGAEKGVGVRELGHWEKIFGRHLNKFGKGTYICTPVASLAQLVRAVDS